MGRTFRLAERRDVVLAPSSPFHFDATMHKPDHFPSPDNAWEPGVRWQAMRWRGEPLGLRFEDRGTAGRPGIRLSVWSRRPLSEDFLAGLVDEISYRCNLDLDLGEFTRRFRDDPLLGPILARWRGMRPASWSSLYEYLIIAIVLQNAVVRRSIQMMQTLLEAYGAPLAYDGRTLLCAWAPEAIAAVREDELRALKLGYRAKSIARVTEAFVGNRVDELALREASADAQRAALLDLYGIGPASVEYVLSDVFHRFDEITHISPWEQRIYSKLFLGRPLERPVPAERLRRYLNRRFLGSAQLAVHYAWEDLFWKWKRGRAAWLDPLIRR